MMNACDELIAQLTETLPEICTINDLIRAGIVHNRASMEYYRRKKMGPAFLRVSPRRIYYPKAGVLKWLKENSFAGEKTHKNSGKIENFPSTPGVA